VDPTGIRTEDLGPALDEGTCDTSISSAGGGIASPVEDEESLGRRLRWANDSAAHGNAETLDSIGGDPKMEAEFREGVVGTTLGTETEAC
jgi:hypothetical protein